MKQFRNRGTRACERPSVFPNRAVRVLGRLFPPHLISPEEVRAWWKKSHEAARWVVTNFDAFELARSVDWELRFNSEGPWNAWPVEVWLPLNGGMPKLIVYSRSPICRLRGSARDAAGQAAMDHAFAHVYHHAAGNVEFGEEDACWMEDRLRRQHFGLWHSVGHLTAPLANFLFRGIDPRVFELERTPTDHPRW